MGIDHSNPYIHSTTVLCDMYSTVLCEMYMYCIERSVNISITRITRVNNKFFCYVAISEIYLHMLIFRLMVTMVAEFCSLVILIHNTLLKEITISNTRTTRVIPQHVLIHFYIQRFNFIDFMVIELRFFKKKNKKKMKKNMDKMSKSFFQILCSYISHHITTNFCIPVAFHMLSTLISLKVKSTSN